MSFSISFKIWTASSTLCKFRLSFLNDKSPNWRNETSRRRDVAKLYSPLKMSQVETMYRWHYDHPQSLKLWMLQKPWKPGAALFLTCTGTWAILFWRASLKRVARESDKSQEQFIAPLALTKLGCELGSEFLYYKIIDWLKGFSKKRQITYYTTNSWWK